MLGLDVFAQRRESFEVADKHDGDVAAVTAFGEQVVGLDELRGDASIDISAERLSNPIPHAQSLGHPVEGGRQTTDLVVGRDVDCRVEITAFDSLRTVQRRP